MKHTQTSEKKLNIFWIDAALSASAGLLLLSAAPLLRTVSGAGPEISTLFAIGGTLLPWSLFNAWTALQRPLRRSVAFVHLSFDSLWILASLGLIARDAARLSLLGHMILVGQSLLTIWVFYRKWIEMGAKARLPTMGQSVSVRPSGPSRASARG